MKVKIKGLEGGLLSLNACVNYCDEILSYKVVIQDENKEKITFNRVYDEDIEQVIEERQK